MKKICREGKYRVIHLKCPKRQALRRVKEKTLLIRQPNSPCDSLDIEKYMAIFLAQSGQFGTRDVTLKTKNGFDNTSTCFHCGRIFEI